MALVREEATPYEAPKHCGDPAAAARFLHPILSSWGREVMGALFLDTRNRAIRHQLAYIGTLTGEVVGIRVVDHIIVGEAPAFVSLRQCGGF